MQAQLQAPLSSLLGLLLQRERTTLPQHWEVSGADSQILFFRPAGLTLVISLGFQYLEASDAEALILLQKLCY